MGQLLQCSVLLKNLRLYAVVSVHFPNALTTQRFDNLCVTHQYQVTHRGLSYEAFFFSSVNIPGETFHCDKRFMVVWEEGPAEGSFYKDPAPPPPEIQILAAPLSAPGDHIEAVVFKVSNQAEDVTLVRNQGLDVDYDMETSPNNVPLVDTPAADTLF